MGSNVSCICAQPAETKFQIEELKREQQLQKYSMSAKPFRTRKKKKKKLKLFEMPSELILTSLARTYLYKQYFKAARLLRTFTASHTLLFTPLPTTPEINLLESNFSLYKVKKITSNTLKFIPAVQIESGGYYEGQWDLMSQNIEGAGVRVYPDDSKFTGYFHEWKKNLCGRSIKKDGEIYEGDYDNDRMQGKGWIVKPSGVKYTGDFEKDLESGKGVEVLNGKVLYEGDFMNGLRHGKGKLFLTDGNVYEGVFKENMFDGFGKYVWTDGTVYVGQWKKNKFHGEGLHTWPDGRKYKGYYNENKRSGYGEFVWSDGREFKGYWANGKMHGEGFFTFSDSSGKKKTMKSLWKNGRREKWL